jgi:hypothetical protein
MVAGPGLMVGMRGGAVLLLCAVACAGRQDRLIGQSADPDPAEEASEPGAGPAFVYLDDEATENAADRDPRALTEFRADLAGYGTWVDNPTYGTIWVPDGPAGFAPYRTDGHWELDPEGNWVWVSEYPWGEVTFHYGRWSWAEGVGWFWVPGYEYAPAWVIWEWGAEYVGWAPAPPAFFWRHRVATAAPRPARLPFFFAPRAEILSRDLPRHLVRDPVHLRRVASRSHVVAHPVPVRAPEPSTATPAPVHVPARAVPTPAGSVRRRVVSDSAHPSPPTPRTPPASAPAPRTAPVRVGRIPPSSLPSHGFAPDPREARAASPPPRAADPRPVELRPAPLARAGAGPMPARGASPPAPSSPPAPLVAPVPRGPVSPPPVAAPARPPVAAPHVAPKPPERPAGHDDHSRRRP